MDPSLFDQTLMRFDPVEKTLSHIGGWLSSSTAAFIGVMKSGTHSIDFTIVKQDFAIGISFGVVSDSETK